MKKIQVFIFTTLLFDGNAFAQNGNKNVLVVKGNVRNAQSDSVRTSLTSFINNGETTYILLNRDGSFLQKYSIEKNQELIIDGHNIIFRLLAKPNDTITLNFDDKDVANTITVHAQTKERTDELNFNIAFCKKFFGETMKLGQKLSEERTLTDSAKVKTVNNFYNDELAFLLSDSTVYKKELRLFFDEIYYQNLSLLLNIFSGNLKNKEFLHYDLTIDGKNLKQAESNLFPYFDGTKSGIQFYQFTDKYAFNNSPAYREFLQSYLSGFYMGMQDWKPLRGYLNAPQNDSTKEYEMSNSDWADNFLWDTYYYALANLNYIPLRDWHITNSLINNFQSQDFNRTEEIYENFLPLCKSESYRTALQKASAFAKKYTQGKPAPNFTLKDENGKTVSLSEFKGKVVLLDFWGVHCGPCIWDLQNTIPKIHEKYKGKNVVFINICVEDTEGNWKDAIKKYNVQGINLFAPGWADNPVCKDYSINGIPHYVLIDKDGNFYRYNANTKYPMQGDQLMKLLN